MKVNRSTSGISKLFRTFKSETGSATVEFVALAIPLFIPIFIYLNHFSSFSANEEIARSMAREVLRVYVISENDEAARDLSGKATQLLARQWNLSDSEVASLRTRMDCTRFPCLTADGRIKLTISFTDEETGRLVTASAQEHLSPCL
jgi:Flp pilus assembly protein TadG